jgi:phosphotransferase system HPr-like phosphotransfer protein
MAPSATSEIAVQEVGVAKQTQVEKHVHGAEEKTPLEAISHGPIIQAGEKVFPLSLMHIW